MHLDISTTPKYYELFLCHTFHTLRKISFSQGSYRKRDNIYPQIENLAYIKMFN
jgi:hypothetical protein